MIKSFKKGYLVFYKIFCTRTMNAEVEHVPLKSGLSQYWEYFSDLVEDECMEFRAESVDEIRKHVLSELPSIEFQILDLRTNTLLDLYAVFKDNIEDIIQFVHDKYQQEKAEEDEPSSQLNKIPREQFIQMLTDLYDSYEGK